MIGIDIIEVERISKDAQSSAFLNRVFTAQELAYVEEYKNKDAHLAGFFCAKEAVMKALEDCDRIAFKDIEVLHKQSGKPYIKLYNQALKIYERNNYKQIRISISQTHTLATAICVID